MFRYVRLATAVLLALAIVGAESSADENSIAAVKQLPDGASVHLSGKVVAKRLWGDRFYIVETDRSSGIGVLGNSAVAEGQVITIDGLKTTQHGEAYITDAEVLPTSSMIVPKPLGVSGKSFLVGASSTGLPVSVWGRPGTQMLSDSLGHYFVLGDGSPDGVRIYVGGSGVQPPDDGFCTVTGISGMNGSLPVVLISDQSDIRSLGGGSVPPETIPEWIWSAAGVARVPFDLNAVIGACSDGADVIEVPVQDTWYSYYPTTFGTPSPTYGNGVLLNQIISYAHSHGARVVGAIPACKDASCLTAHTDWRQRPTDSTSWLTHPADQVTGCLVSPYKGYLINEILELAQSTSLDGVTLQGYSNTHAFCYCNYCKAKYLADTGGTIPASVNYDDANFRRYLLWHDAQIVSHLTSLRAQVRSADFNFGLFAWSSNAGEYSHYSASPRIAPTGLNTMFDCVLQNARYDEANLGLSVVPEFGVRYLSALARHQPFISEAYYQTRSADATAGIVGSSLPEEEIRLRALASIASGGKLSFSSTEKSYLRSSLFDLARARSPWTYKAMPVKYAAMVVSETTRQFYGRSDALSKYMHSCFGYLRAMLECHLPVDILTEADLENGLAAGYKALILPNTACLSAAGAAAVRSFVSAGGGLVATGAASLYDDQGSLLTDFALSDLLKASSPSGAQNVASQVTVSGTLYSRNESLSTILSPYGLNTSFIGEFLPVTVSSGGAAMANLSHNSTIHPFYINNPNGAGGRVAYFPAAVDAAYYKYPYPYQGVLLKDAVTWAANSVPRVTVVGPKSVRASFFTQNDGKRLVVHLLNMTNSRGGRANPAYDLPARDEVTPVYDVEVWFEDVAPTAIRLQPENTVLTPSVHEGRTRVVVSELSQHSMVVAEIP